MVLGAVAVIASIGVLVAGACWQREPAPGVELRIGSFQATASVTPDPPRAGRNSLFLEIRDEAGETVADATLSASAVMAAMGSMPEMRSVARSEVLASGRYRLDFELGMSGSWSVTLRIEKPGAAPAELHFELKTGVPVRFAQAAAGESPGEHAGHAIDYWTCPMHPSVNSPDPGRCPICGMELVPVMRPGDEAGVVVIDAQRRQRIGIKTAPASRSEVVVLVQALGTLVPDETRLHDVSLKFDGWVGEVFANYSGFAVVAGQPLFDVYSPELLSAQEEFLEGERRAGAGANRSLAETAHRRLRLWGIGERQIAELAKAGRALERVPILSPVTGTVLEKNVVGGSAVSAGERLYRIADLSALWLEAAVYEADLPLLKVGQRAQVSFPYQPGETVEASVAWVPPGLDAESRTARVRLELPNRAGLLKPQMYASVSIEIPLGVQLVVPIDAVVMSGRANVVFVDLGDGRLQPRRIGIGRRSPQGFIVLEGLQEGEQVVTAGNFLIASESRLQAGMDAW
jgi:membrane fusion protein, copper/silver efflux system